MADVGEEIWQIASKNGPKGPRRGLWERRRGDARGEGRPKAKGTAWKGRRKGG